MDAGSPYNRHVLALATPLAVLLGAAAPTPIAVLPITGDGVSLADLGMLESMDAVVRAAVRERPELVLQERGLTAEIFRNARDAGIECRANDVACVRQIGALAGVELVLVPVATPSGQGVELELTLLSATDEGIVSRSALVKGRGRASDAFVRVLVGDVLTSPRTTAPVVRSLTASDAPKAAEPAPAGPPPASAPAAEPAAEPAPDGVPPWIMVAGGAGALGAVIAAVVGGVLVAGALGGGSTANGDEARLPSSGPAVVVLE